MRVWKESETYFLNELLTVGHTIIFIYPSVFNSIHSKFLLFLMGFLYSASKFYTLMFFFFGAVNCMVIVAYLTVILFQASQRGFLPDVSRI